MKLLNPFRQFMDFCYPRVCSACGNSADGDILELCSNCLIELRKLEQAPACERCAMPLAFPGTPCPYCMGEGIRPFERIVRLSTYEEPIRELIHRIKFSGRWPLAEFLADRLLMYEPARALLAETDVLVPVPLHPWRQLPRGYNQAELIAKRLARRCRIKLDSPLVRLRKTEPQTQLHSKAQRYENLRDAFGLADPRSVQKKHVTLVDDVMTTGATLSWAAKALGDAEPASISVIVLAIADPKGRGFETI